VTAPVNALCAQYRAQGAWFRATRGAARPASDRPFMDRNLPPNHRRLNPARL